MGLPRHRNSSCFLGFRSSRSWKGQMSLILVVDFTAVYRRIECYSDIRSSSCPQLRTLTRLFVQAAEEDRVHAAQRRQRRRDARVAERVQLPVRADDIPIECVGQPPAHIGRTNDFHQSGAPRWHNLSNKLSSPGFTCGQGSSGQ